MMKLHSFEFTIENSKVLFYHNTKTHRWEISIDYGTDFFETSYQRGLAIVAFLKALGYKSESGVKERGG